MVDFVLGKLCVCVFILQCRILKRSEVEKFLGIEDFKVFTRIMKNFRKC